MIVYLCFKIGKELYNKYELNFLIVKKNVKLVLAKIISYIFEISIMERQHS